MCLSRHCTGTIENYELPAGTPLPSSEGQSVGFSVHTDIDEIQQMTTFLPIMLIFEGNSKT
jgi:hypothetical protein